MGGDDVLETEMNEVAVVIIQQQQQQRRVRTVRI
jgi:hypothetical protein